MVNREDFFEWYVKNQQKLEIMMDADDMREIRDFITENPDMKIYYWYRMWSAEADTSEMN
ncbi:MAG: hypothetical protein LUD41_02465 [Phascolarctobacterium sp.]|nr:hypothetical protein [Phascolarctobacterium sp.]